MQKKRRSFYGLPEKRRHCRSGDRIAEMRPMPSDLAQNTYGDSDENLLPEPASRSPFAKLLDKIAGQSLVVTPWTRMPQQPHGCLRRIGFPMAHERLPSTSGMPLHRFVSAERVIVN